MSGPPLSGRCSELTGQASGLAPDVRGRIAYWANGGTDLAWQYAPGSWAVLQAQSSGSTPFPAAQAKSLLPELAASVKFGQTRLIVFPFKLSGAVPADWHAVSATYTVLPTGQYLANQLDVAPYASYEEHGVTGLIIDAAETPGAGGNSCDTSHGGAVASTSVTSTVRKDGVSWLVESPGTHATQPSGQPGQPGQPGLPEDDATACSQQPDNGLYAYADLKLDTTGAARTGGIGTVLTHLRLSAEQENWTSTPVAG